MKNLFLYSSLLLFVSGSVIAQKTINQIDISVVAAMPNMPTPYKMKNWKQIGIKQDAFLYDFNAKGALLPLIWWDDSHVNMPGRSFGLPSYVGSIRQKGTNEYESLPVMGSLLGASLLGIDKSNVNGVDFVGMTKHFYNAANGANLIMNKGNLKMGNTFWYEIWPGMAFSMLVDQYPAKKDLAEIMQKNAAHWLDIINNLSVNRPFPDFNFTSYSLEQKKGVYNGVWHEPDAAAGLAWLEFTAWKNSRDDRYLKASKACMAFLQYRPAKEGPFYEVMMPYGAYLAVRMNAELGTSYDEIKMLNWCFDGNNSDRDGWGVISERWGDDDVYGLVGQKKEEQYAFAMNTYSHAAALVPIVKYNPAYSKTIGKWLLNLANASRLFYADEHPKNRQTSGIWQGDPDHVISYEGLRKDLDHGNDFAIFKGILTDKGPYAVGDQVKQYRSMTDICIYGSAWVGMLGAIVDTTNVKGILKLDCNKTDFYADRSIPSYLYYNPYKEVKTVEIDLGNGVVDVYDRVSKKILIKHLTGKQKLAVPAEGALSLALIPVTLKVLKRGNKILAGTYIIDYLGK
ncbi:hypothetical protein IDJ75_16015 [Mucilaginibacter rigui]|uniref:Uncharacterized protein n=2 Tax=Mucilaginibacter rigui TaxID=534635 RepID=A0ABR7XAZ9_9SPHI|nr:hypothetical protein [Mucilaginibacter rigui]